MNIGYKLVRVAENGDLVSYGVASYRNLNIVYVPNTWTPYRKIGPFIFDTIDNATMFCGCTFVPFIELWKCEYDTDTGIKWMLNMVFYRDNSTRGKIYKALRSSLTPTPNGTIVTHRIRLIEKVMGHGM